MSRSIGLKSLAISLPDRILTNDHWRDNYPHLVTEAAGRAATGWEEPPDSGDGCLAFDRAMVPFLEDPFHGAWQRRVLSPGSSALDLEADAVRRALVAALLGPEDVDLLLCSSLLPDHQGIGSAAFLARELEMEGAAWNVESEGSSALIAFQTACSLIATGRHRTALVVTSCTYSRLTEEADPAAWGIGDAATAMVVGPVADGVGYLSGHSVHTAQTCGAIAYHVERSANGPRVRLRSGRRAVESLRETSEGYLKACTNQALDKAGIRLDDIDHFVFSTPLAWYAVFCARALGIDRKLTLSVYPLYANAGPALLGLNLFHAAHWRSFQPGELVLLYSVGSVSSCSAAVLRWGDVALAELPEDGSLARLHEIEKEHLAGFRLGRLEAEVLAPTRGVAEPERRLRGVVQAYVELAIDEPGVMTLFLQEGDIRPLGAATRERAEAFIGALETDISDVLVMQQRVPDLDTTVAALSLLGIVHWGVCSYRAEGRLSREEAVEQIVFLALHGLTTRPARPSRAAVA